ncbi:MAG: SAM-dependent methyltransferase [Bacteroidales bacterium]|nr:SAM-dependent methyltransferase [Bacteroidales bacterium]
MDKETLKFIAEHRNDDVRTLALQAARYPNIDMREVVTQVEGWQHACIKLPEWAAVEGILYPPRISMEQCSSSATALYKASLMQGDTFADLTGGFGIDCSYISRNFTKAFYVERNENLCTVAAHNFALLGLHNIEVINGDSEQQLPTLPLCDWIFLDPARRDGAGKKVVALADCEPDVAVLRTQLLQKARRVMVKCSPMLDVTAACRQLGCVADVHVVAVNNECKELLFILSSEIPDKPRVHCVNILGDSSQTFSFPMGDTHETIFASEVGNYLYEPNAAIQKAGCPSSLAANYGVHKLHRNSNLYTSQMAVENFPGRTFCVTGVGGFSKNELKKLLGDLEKANLTVRNFPETVQQLRKRLKLSEGGDVYLFATTLADGRKVLVRCEKG